ncbi:MULTISPECIES: hypothetical protein [unclassified Virgibacillus]|nr:hypothetical protein [Virgibacillus sp. LDC-1]
MVNKEKKFNNQFKDNQHHGEHRNGRLSPFKNSNSQGEGEMNEYVSQKKK